MQNHLLVTEFPEMSDPRTAQILKKDIKIQGPRVYWFRSCMITRCFVKKIEEKGPSMDLTV